MDFVHFKTVRGKKAVIYHYKTKKVYLKIAHDSIKVRDLREPDPDHPGEALMKEDYKDLSLGAKMLYVLLLKNKWYDKNGQVYVYFSVKEICKVLGICKDKARKLLRELDVENGIGLIRRVRRGQGKCDKIYVMCFQKGEESDIKENVTTNIINPKAYNIAVLYNAPLTMNSSVNAEYRRNSPEYADQRSRK